MHCDQSHYCFPGGGLVTGENRRSEGHIIDLEATLFLH